LFTTRWREIHFLKVCSAKTRRSGFPNASVTAITKYAPALAKLRVERTGILRQLRFNRLSMRTLRLIETALRAKWNITAQSIAELATSHHGGGAIEDAERPEASTSASDLRRHLIRRRQTLVSADLDVAKTFADLHAQVYMAIMGIKWIGELAVYDIAQRISSYRGLLPDAVYLHAVTRESARALGLSGHVLPWPIFRRPSRD
jgi:hypothetical protein